MTLKTQFIQKGKFCHPLLNLSLVQSCIHLFVLLNTKEDVWKNVSNSVSNRGYPFTALVRKKIYILEANG